MRDERKTQRRRFLHSLAGLCTLFVFDPSAIFGTGTRSRIEPRVILTVLQRKVRNDFELGRTIEVDGWILSETEAALCTRITRSNPGTTSRHRPGRNRGKAD